MKRLLLVYSVVLALAGTYVVATTGQKTSELNPNDKTGEVDAKQKGATREGYVTIVEKKLREWDDVIARVEKGTYPDKSVKEESSPSERKDALKELRGMKAGVEKKLAQLKKAGTKDWEKIRDDIQDQLDDMQDRFGNIVGE